jgi:hypothetical protein
LLNLGFVITYKLYLQLNKRKAVILFKGKKYNICCDLEFLQEFMAYFSADSKHLDELKLIFHQVREGLTTKKYGDEPFGTKAMKPFKNRENDRIICKPVKRKNNTQCIVMAEIFLHKTSNQNDKELTNRYKIVSDYEYEIIESDH